MNGPIFADLVLDTGELVRIECPGKFEDQFWDSIEHAMKRRDWWSASRFDGCHAEFMGQRMERINMAKVVGTL